MSKDVVHECLFIDRSKDGYGPTIFRHKGRPPRLGDFIDYRTRVMCQISYSYRWHRVSFDVLTIVVHQLDGLDTNAFVGGGLQCTLWTTDIPFTYWRTLRGFGDMAWTVRQDLRGQCPQGRRGSSPPSDTLI